jgi:hypothetical protein
VTRRGVLDILSSVRQGLSLEVDFGSHSIEALLAVAETLESSIYEPGSFEIAGTRLSFGLLNPPLRVGAFSAAVLRYDGHEVPPGRAWWRPTGTTEWRSTAEISPGAPLLLRPGDRTQFAVDLERRPDPGPVTLRLELTSVAIPPTVWMEIAETPRPVPP